MERDSLPCMNNKAKQGTSELNSSQMIEKIKTITYSPEAAKETHPR